jgi:hypothetical protein
VAIGGPRLNAAPESGSRIRRAPEKSGEAGLVEAVLGDGDERLVEFRVGRRTSDAVPIKERESSEDSGTLVSIKEGLRLRDVQRVGGGNGKEVRSAVMIGGLSCCYRGLD